MFVVYRGFYQVLVLLAIRALGKSKFVLCQVPSHNRRPESAVLYLVDYSSNVVPSIKESYLLKWLNFEMFGHGWRSHTRSYSYTFFSQAIIIIDCIHFLQYIYSIYILKSKMEKMDPLNICFPGMKWYPRSSFWFVCPTEELSENGLRYVKLALQLHEAFNFAQMLQGEILAQQWGPRENRDSDGIWTNCRRTDIITCNFRQTVHVQGLYLLYPFVNICANKKPGRDKWWGSFVIGFRG